MSLLVELILLVNVYIDHVINYVFSFFYNNPKRVSKISNPLLLESATSLARKIRSKQITSEHLVKLFIARIQEVNPLINAVVENRFEIALAEAKEVDYNIKNSTANFDEKPFLGVPFTTKESFHCKGMKSTFGLVPRKDIIAEEDANVILSLKKAGGILLAVTNVPQLCMWQETGNPIYGITKNPYDTTRNVGGSSGGEAAIIAACGSPFGIASDIGGSVRLPSFTCGLFGHKPTHDLISNKGMTFRVGNEGPTMATAGTMTKYAEDIIPFLKVLLDKNVNQLKLDEVVNIADLNIYYVIKIKAISVSSIGNEMKNVIARTVKYFKNNCKNAPQELDWPEFAKGMQMWKYMSTQEKGTNFMESLTNRQRVLNPAWEIVKFLTRTGEFNAFTIMFCLSYLLVKPEKKYDEIISKLKTELLTKLGTNGVLLFPSFPWSARYHYTSLLRPMNLAYFVIWSALKLPVTQVPLGLDKEGLPVGIQVVAAPYQDHLCIAVAKELEKAFGGYVPPNIGNTK